MSGKSARCKLALAYMSRDEAALQMAERSRRRNAFQQTKISFGVVQNQAVERADDKAQNEEDANSE